MTTRMTGKVAFVTGAARGQGRAHALRLAEEGADIVAVDICKQIPSNPYPLATPEDLAETVREVEATGRRIVAVEGDVRQREQLADAIKAGIGEFGHLDTVVANAGILPMAHERSADAMDFVDALDVDLVGVINTVAVAIPHLPDRSSIVIIASTAGLMNGTTDNPALGPGGSGYKFSKRTLVSYTEQLALHLAPRFIRVNAIHPTNVNTHLLHHTALYKVFRPDIESPTLDDVMEAFTAFQAMPIPFVEPLDVSNLVLFLASDESRYITGQQIRVDAGALLKAPPS